MTAFEGLNYVGVAGDGWHETFEDEDIELTLSANSILIFSAKYIAEFDPDEVMHVTTATFASDGTNGAEGEVTHDVVVRTSTGNLFKVVREGTDLLRGTLPSFLLFDFIGKESRNILAVSKHAFKGFTVTKREEKE